MTFREIIIIQLKKGNTIQEISEELKKINFEPNSISSVEKELKKLRADYNAKTMFHLAYLIQQKDIMTSKTASPK